MEERVNAKTEEEVEEEIKGRKIYVDKIPFGEIIEEIGPEILEPKISEASTEDEIVPADFEVVSVKSTPKLLGPIGELPNLLIDFCWTEFNGIKNAWYRIDFPRKFKKPPAVFVSVEARPGWFLKEKLTPPKIKISRKWFYDPTVDQIATANEVRNAVYKDCTKMMGDWGIFNWIRNAICGAIAGIGWIIGYFIAVFWNVVAPMIGRGIRDSLTSTFELEDGTNVLSQLQTLLAEYSLNQSIPMLYNFSGLPQMKLPIGTYRNVTESSVEVLGYEDTKITVFAIGYASNPLDTFVTRTFKELLK